MAKPGFVEARPKGGGDIRLVPEHYLTNEAFGFVEVPSIRDTGKKATRRPSAGPDPVEEEEAK
ncbi:hypothetical protein [Glutamicibacter sp.]|uniref:hypothetical protein n=1 Tax=Glutamicibacter sp. TaxID=1931995 RepID=UPI0028BEE08F|nr:hypothetical protein [Glutamicibacter sp.]